MRVEPMKGISNFAPPITSAPANLPAERDGRIPANDNLKHDNVQVTVKSVMPEAEETPSGRKTLINYIA